jgi:hypothetical protein
MLEIKYGEILKKAFFFSWKHKFLWFFGFLISLSLILNEVINLGSNDFLKEAFSADKSFGVAVAGLQMISHWPLALLAVSVFLIAVRILSFGALIRSINNPVLFQQKKVLVILKETFEFFWRLLGIDFFLSALALVLFFLLAVPVAILFSLKANLFGSITLLAAILILLPFLILSFFLKKFGYIFAVLSGFDLKSSLDFSYKILLKNLKESLRMALEMLSFEILAVCFLTTSIFIFGAVLFALFGFVDRLPFVQSGGPWVLNLVLIILAGLFFGALSFLTVNIQAAWFEFFAQISMQKNKEKISAEEKVLENEIPNPEVA